ncbi:hypothetical protein LIER_03724 [Lithospermum erythrorhizon]|uniref:Uncharacterized protein n=1 Tax=Lithospermum erythrorhizon TaxID=34254 RepID=A0AAV3NU57_LITER
MSAKNALNETQKTVTPVDQSTLVNGLDLVNSATNQGGETSRTTEEHRVPPLSSINHGKLTNAEAVGQRKSSKMKLTFIPPEVVNGKPVVKYQSRYKKVEIL